MNFDKRFIIGSFLFHIIIIVLLSSVSFNHNLNKSFIVFGAHSKKPTHAYFKPLKAPRQQSVIGGSKANVSSKKKIKKKNVKQKKKQKTKKETRQNKKAEPKKKVEPKKKAEPKKLKPKIKPEKKLNIKEHKQKQAIIKKEVKKLESKKERKKEEKREFEKEIKQVKPEPKEVEEEILTFDLIASSDTEVYEYQRSIQKTVSSIWRPPIGVVKGTEATVSFVINKSGEIKGFEILDEPKNLLYKLSIIKVAKRFVFEKCLWGKRFNIIFRQ